MSIGQVTCNRFFFLDRKGGGHSFVCYTEEIFDDSEEDDRLESRRLRLRRDQEARTDSSSSFVSWRVVVVLLVVLCVLICLVSLVIDARQKLERQR